MKTYTEIGILVLHREPAFQYEPLHMVEAAESQAAKRTVHSNHAVQ